jgi:hypothetical protein
MDRSVVVGLDGPGLSLRVQRALDLFKEGSRGLLDRVFLESIELIPIVCYVSNHFRDSTLAISPIQEEPNYIAIILDRKVEVLEWLLGVLSTIPDGISVVMSAAEENMILELTTQGSVLWKWTFVRDEAPWFMRDNLRRTIHRVEGDEALTCPYCKSVISPRVGKLWGLWCPTCDVRLVVIE